MKIEHICITLFLGAIIAADLLVTNFGPSALPFTAFFLIPFDLVTRDILHEKWKGGTLWPKMFLLVCCGGVVAYILNRDAINVAKASVLAFTCATFINTFIYSVMGKYKVFFKMNTSNLFASITDSIIFPYIAFGVLPLNIMVEQSSAKFLGGLMWSHLFLRFINKKHITK